MFDYKNIQLNNVDQLAHIIGFKYTLQERGHGWFFLFIQDQDEVSLGRMTFINEKLHSYRSYKKHYHKQVDETDFIFLRIKRFLLDGTLIDQDAFDLLVKQAEQIREQDLVKCHAWREANPLKGQKKRRRLEGRNVRQLLDDLVMNYN